MSQEYDSEHDLLELTRQEKLQFSELKALTTKQRFHVGFRSQDGRVSPRFTIVVEPRGDVYVTADSVRNGMKVSLHADGRCSVSVPSETHKRSGKPNQQRHFTKWTMPLYSPQLLAFRIIVPEFALHNSTLIQGKSARWLRSPKTGEIVSIGFWMWPPQPELNFVVSQYQPPLFSGKLRNGRFLSVKVDYAPPTPDITGYLDLVDQGRAGVLPAFMFGRSPSGVPQIVYVTL